MVKIAASVTASPAAHQRLVRDTLTTFLLTIRNYLYFPGNPDPGTRGTSEASGSGPLRPNGNLPVNYYRLPFTTVKTRLPSVMVPGDGRKLCEWLAGRAG
jgi:hypothetical protein